MDDHWMRQERKAQMIKLAEEGEWKNILDIYESRSEENGHRYHEPLLVWVRPSRQMLNFIQTELNKLNVSSILSIGCGCGFLEWLLSRATDLKVSGLEVNKGWWESRHSTPHLIPLTYTEPGVIPKMPGRDTALLFCYFNSLVHFDNYLDHFEGDVLVLIGPVDGQRHCEPAPHDLERSEGWTAVAVHDIQGAGEDHVVVYKRTA